MAIFTSKADADLPILTQFYQLRMPSSETDIEGIKELSNFLFRFGAAPAPAGHGQTLDEMAEVWGEVHRVSRVVMDALADNGTINAEDLKFIEEITSWVFPSRQIVLRFRLLSRDGGIVMHNTPLHTIPKLTDFPINDVFLEPIGDISPPMRQVIVSLMELFSYPAERPKVRRCQECQSPYLVAINRPRQAFCSRRCQSRVAERERYSGKIILAKS